MAHCVGADMFEFVANGPINAPAFSLVNQGYDVWMGNNRGTTWSLGHVSKSSKQKSRVKLVVILSFYGFKILKVFKEINYQLKYSE